MLYGTAWGLVRFLEYCLTILSSTPPDEPLQVTPIGPNGRTIPPFGHLAGVPSHALFFGSLLGLQKLAAKSCELVRRQSDVGNELFGLGVVWPYYRYVLNHSERRLVLHHRLVGSLCVASLLYAQVVAA